MSQNKVRNEPFNLDQVIKWISTLDESKEPLTEEEIFIAELKISISKLYELPVDADFKKMAINMIAKGVIAKIDHTISGNGGEREETDQREFMMSKEKEEKKKMKIAEEDQRPGVDLKTIREIGQLCQEKTEILGIKEGKNIFLRIRDKFLRFQCPLKDIDEIIDFGVWKIISSEFGFEVAFQRKTKSETAIWGTQKEKTKKYILKNAPNFELINRNLNQTIWREKQKEDLTKDGKIKAGDEGINIYSIPQTNEQLTTPFIHYATGDKSGSSNITGVWTIIKGKNNNGEIIKRMIFLPVLGKEDENGKNKGVKVRDKATSEEEFEPQKGTLRWFNPTLVTIPLHRDKTRQCGGNSYAFALIENSIIQNDENLKVASWLKANKGIGNPINHVKETTIGLQPDGYGLDHPTIVQQEWLFTMKYPISLREGLGNSLKKKGDKRRRVQETSLLVELLDNPEKLNSAAIRKVISTEGQEGSETEQSVQHSISDNKEGEKPNNKKIKTS